MTNDNLNRGEFVTIAAPIAANSGVGPKSGDPLVIGTGDSPEFGLACVAQTSYTSPTPSAVPTGNISVRFIGVVLLSVKAKVDMHGGGNVAINPGDQVYADTDGTRDATTGVYYGFSLTANDESGIYFGNALDAIASGTTATVRVRLKVSGN
jgi:Uncharacterized conserved protein (DUF2190)